MKRVLAVIAITCLLLTGCLKQDAAVQGSAGDEEQAQPTIAVQPAGDDYTEIDKLGRLFGFTNESGGLILMPGGLPEAANMADVNRAVGENGNILTIKYLKEQKRNENDNGRFTAQNFDNLEGYVFEIIQGAAKGNETYYLVNEGELNTKAVLKSREGDHSEIDTAARAEIEKVKSRKIRSSWEIGKIDPDKTIYLILFEREGEDMLASIVMKAPDKIVFKDYPAKYDASSTWRVDDGGTVYPNMFNILFAAKTENGMLLGLKWTAFEGENTVLLRENDGVFEELDIEASRYMSPI